VKLKDNTSWEPTSVQIEDWKSKFPNLSVEAELQKMSAWADANPQKRKTRNGVTRFVTSWLLRASSNQAPTTKEVWGSDLGNSGFERDEFVHALNTCMSFFGKTLEPGQVKLWHKALSGHPIDRIKIAFEDYLSIGKYSPRPVDILGIMSEYKERESSAQPVEKAPENPCPPEIAKAWLWFLAVTTTGSRNFSGTFAKRDVPDEVAERYLEIVNTEAHKNNQPEAIPEEFRTAIWDSPF